MLLNADIRQNITLQEGNLEKHKKAKEIFIELLKTRNQSLC